MHFRPLPEPIPRPKGLLTKTILIMKCTVVLLLAFCLQVSAAGYSQVSLTETNTPLRSVLKKIQKQTGYDFLYGTGIVQEAGSVTIDVNNVSLERALELCLANKPLSYSIIEKTVVIRPKLFEPPVSAAPEPVQVKEVITGKVTDDKGNPLSGATVTLRGTKTAAATNAAGFYSLEVEELRGTLVVSYVGMATLEMPINGRKSLDISLMPATEDMTDVVVIGYGTQKKETLSGAVANIKSKEINTTKSTSVVSNLQGKVPGLHIRQQTAEPGQFNSLVSIRGFGAPLLVIDGVPRDGMSDFERLNPEDIESISVLKDAAAAIYGMNADNGVIIVTTKRGQKGKSKFNYSGYYGFKQPTSMPNMVDAYTYRMIRNEMDKNTKLAPSFSQTEIDKWKAGTDPGYQDYDWMGNTLRNFTAQQQHNLSVSGGTDNVTYYTSLGYLADDGILRSGIQKYRKYNFRNNVTFNINKNLKAIITLAGKFDQNRGPEISYFWLFKPIIIADRAIPPVIPGTNNVTRIPPDFTNPYALSTESVSGYERYANIQYQTNLELQYDAPFLDGLKLGVLAAYDGNNNNYSKLSKAYNQFDLATGAAVLRGQNRYSNSMNQFGRGVVQTSANYKKRIAGDHNISATVVGEMRALRNDIIGANRFYSDVYTWDVLDQGSRTNMENSGNRIIQKYLSLLGRLNYDYQGKYLVEMAFRNDGSYRYAPDKRWAFFPSASAGWRISEEKFMQKSLPWVSNLKLRGSYGMMGADAGNPFEYYLGYSLGSIDRGYVFNNGILTAGMVPPGVLNENLTWVKTNTANIGIDVSLWNGKLGIIADWFQKNRNGLLGNKLQSVPNTFGASFPQENINKDMVKGFEVMVSHKHHIGRLKYDLSANMTYARKYLVYTEQAPYASSWQRWNETWGTGGRVLGRDWGYVTNGRYTDLRQYQTAPLMGGTLGNSRMLPGSHAIEDVDGNGVINGDDRLPVFWSGQYGGFAGNPPLQYGATINLSYGAFDLNVLFQGASLFSIIQSPNDVWGYGRYATLWDKYLDRWRLEDPNADPYDPNAKWIGGEFPALRSNFTGTTDNFITNQWRVNATYLRIKSMELGYTVPARFTKRMKIDGLRVYANGFNLFTFANKLARHLDPEREEGAYAADLTYPLMRSFNFGINLNF
jgi:TonB-linked SusC/RagA family outer membrane protein